MADSASRADVQQVFNLVRNLEARVNNLNNELKNLHETLHSLQGELHTEISGAIAAVSDENTDSGSRYQDETEQALVGLRDDIKTSHQHLKHLLDELYVQVSYIRQSYEEEQSGHDKRYG
jgi:uncharacterized phage infection (PIP) family protein YhgE